MMLPLLAVILVGGGDASADGHDSDVSVPSAFKRAGSVSSLS